jgi:hypothetical protein|nr:MAG TPA: hypothetical protein [Caudoviricetes sp.]
MAKQKDVAINRREYERIKRYDHTQMNNYIRSIYKDGFDSGIEEAKNRNEKKDLNIELIKVELANIKGIGPTKMAQVIKVLEERIG